MTKKSMASKPEFHDVQLARLLDLAAGSGNAMQFVQVARRGGVVSIPAGWTSVWLLLSGSLHLESSHNDWRLTPGQVLVWTEGALQGHCRTAGWCLVLAAPAHLWSHYLHASAYPSLELMPNERRCPRELGRMIVHACRLAKRGTMGAVDPVMQTIVTALLESQADLAELLPRCNGRTLRSRQQNLQRLLRVRHVIRHNLENKPDTPRLARIANYSPHHLIRIHRNVFGETPAEYANRLRTMRAWDLVNDTRMPICEIAESLGFESQSAFCRAFKKSFGMTTGQVRRGDVPVQDADLDEDLFPESRAA